MVDGILPAAGLATRMRGLPKFLLPCDDQYTTLIEKHVTKLLSTCETVWIPTRPEQTILLETLGLSSDRVVVVPMTTGTMTQTVLRLANISGAPRFVLVMPDTYFFGEQPYEYLATSKNELNLACWDIRPEQRGKLGQVLIEKGGETKEESWTPRIKTLLVNSLTPGVQWHLIGQSSSLRKQVCLTPDTS